MPDENPLLRCPRAERYLIRNFTTWSQPFWDMFPKFTSHQKHTHISEKWHGCRFADKQNTFTRHINSNIRSYSELFLFQQNCANQNTNCFVLYNSILLDQ